MANLGAEVSKILSAKKRNDKVLLAEYLKKASEILREIVILPEMKNRQAEMAKLAEVIQDMNNPKPVLTVSAKNLTSYFIPFALRLMDQR